MAAAGGGSSRLGFLLCCRVTSALTNLQNITAHRQYTNGVVQSAAFLVKKQGKSYVKDCL